MITSRIVLTSAAPAVYGAISALDDGAQFEPALRELVRVRASQINGCGYCVDYHSRGRAARAASRIARIFALTTWRESPFFDERERAALELTEALTRMPEGGVPDETYERAARRFSDGELGQLLGVIVAMNAWNRVGVGTGLQPDVAA